MIFYSISRWSNDKFLLTYTLNHCRFFKTCNMCIKFDFMEKTICLYPLIKISPHLCCVNLSTRITAIIYRISTVHLENMENVKKSNCFWIYWNHFFTSIWWSSTVLHLVPSPILRIFIGYQRYLPYRSCIKIILNLYEPCL